MSSVGIGSIATSAFTLPDVYYIPSLALNIVSVSQLCKAGFLISFTSSNCSIQDPHSQKVIGTGHRHGGLYLLETLKVSEVAASTVDLSSFQLTKSSSPFYLCILI